MKLRRHLQSMVAHLGSLRSTLAWLALLAAVVLAAQVSGPWWTAGLALVLAGLGVNLLAAIVVHPAFRRQLPLLVAHLALLALVVLAGVGRLASLDGRFELTEGVPFDGRLIDARSGPWHRDGLQRLGFAQHGFDIAYAPGRKRGATRNRVSWRDDEGTVQHAVIGDHRPLRLDGYRIYTSPNKGFAPLLRWLPERGEAVAGAVHLPSFPVHELRQSREWPLPDGRTAWVQLQFDETLIDPNAAANFKLPERHRLVLRVGELRAELAPGDRAAIGGGVLVYDGLRTWMGYRITHDFTLPWLLAASLLASLALAWHFVRKFTAPARRQNAPAPAPLAVHGALSPVPASLHGASSPPPASAGARDG
jgi:hypothetical protein